MTMPATAPASSEASADASSGAAPDAAAADGAGGDALSSAQARRAAAAAIAGPADDEAGTSEAEAEAPAEEPADEAPAAAKSTGAGVSLDGLRELAKTDPAGAVAKALEAIGVKGAPDWHAYRKRAGKISQQEQAIERARAELDQHVQGFQAKVKRLDELEGLVALAKDDPVELLEKLGLDMSDLTVRTLQRGKPEEAITRQQRELEALKAELEAERKAKQEAAEAAARQAEVKAAEDLFVAVVTPEDFPHLTRFKRVFGERAMLVEAHTAVAVLRKELGRNPSNTEIAKRIDDGADAFFAKVRDEGNGDPAASSGSGERETQAAPAAKPGVGKPKTLTNVTASARTNGTPIASLTPKERRKLAAQI